MDNTIARDLLEIEAVSLRVDPPFTWASGRLSPIYCDNRLLMSFPDRRLNVARGFVTLMETKGWKPEVIAGTATAGIPHAAWLSELSNLPMVYVRGAAKQHGKGNRVEGRLEPGQKVVLIEDLISTGGSSIEAARGLEEAGADLLGVAAIFTYGLDKAASRFEEAGVRWAALTNFETLMEEAQDRGILTSESKAILADWQKDPAAWSLTRGGG
ncbi:MAG: orotate phosphoribosyltransferase [Proteobacteria bacterium]|nr:orotate phosphoribosyltransferase [Pseudomonadota bacterium]